MFAWLHRGRFARSGSMAGPGGAAPSLIADQRSAWAALPHAAQFYIAGVSAVGAYVLAVSFPRTLARPAAFAALLVVACLTSIYKVKLVLSAKNESTLSIAYASVLMALVLLGPQAAMVIAVAAALTQCTFRVERRYPAH